MGKECKGSADAKEGNVNFDRRPIFPFGTRGRLRNSVRVRVPITITSRLVGGEGGAMRSKTYDLTESRFLGNSDQSQAYVGLGKIASPTPGVNMIFASSFLKICPPFPLLLLLSLNAEEIR